MEGIFGTVWYDSGTFDRLLICSDLFVFWFNTNTIVVSIYLSWFMISFEHPNYDLSMVHSNNIVTYHMTVFNDKIIFSWWHDIELCIIIYIYMFESIRYCVHSCAQLDGRVVSPRLLHCIRNEITGFQAASKNVTDDGPVESNDSVSSLHPPQPTTKHLKALRKDWELRLRRWHA